MGFFFKSTWNFFYNSFESLEWCKKLINLCVCSNASVWHLGRWPWTGFVQSGKVRIWEPWSQDEQHIPKRSGKVRIMTPGSGNVRIMYACDRPPQPPQKTITAAVFNCDSYTLLTYFERPWHLVWLRHCRSTGSEAKHQPGGLSITAAVFHPNCLIYTLDIFLFFFM